MTDEHKHPPLTTAAFALHMHVLLHAVGEVANAPYDALLEWIDKAEHLGPELEPLRWDIDDMAEKVTGWRELIAAARAFATELEQCAIRSDERVAAAREVKS